jgi:transcriptional regulator with XRE-family HTH domain
MATVIGPAATLAEWMAENGISFDELTRRAGYGASGVTLREVLAGQPLTAAHLQTLHRATRVPPRFWLNHEADYRAALAAGLEDRTRQETPMTPDPPWDLTEAERRQFREAHAAAQAAAANEAAGEPRYPPTPARVAKDLEVLGYRVGKRGQPGWRAFWVTDANTPQAVRVELSGASDADLTRLAGRLRELGWLAVVKEAGWIVVTATTTPPAYLPSELGLNSDDPETAWTRPFRRRAAE